LRGWGLKKRRKRERNAKEKEPLSEFSPVTSSFSFFFNDKIKSTRGLGRLEGLKKERKSHRCVPQM